MSVTVDVQVATACSELPPRADIERWARAALRGADRGGELTVRVVDAQEGAMLNREYRHADRPTNVLSFPFECPPGVDLPLVGDVVICAPVVLREAREQGKAPRSHFAHLVVHGALHLLGFDHDDAPRAARMEAMERGILAGLGFPDPYPGEGA